MSRSLRADCVVVGGGPAGSTTALLLARAGFDVVLLERYEFPRAKPCGDCISPQANLLLDELGLLAAVETLQPARLAGWRIHAPGGDSFTAHFRDYTKDPRVEHGIAISRTKLDEVLLVAAREAGVRVFTGVRVEQLLNGGPAIRGVRGRDAEHQHIDVTARLTIGADGLRSVVQRALGMNGRSPGLRKVALSAHVSGIAGLSEFGELHLQDGACIGIAPIDARNQIANLTLVVDTTRFGRSLAGKSMTAFQGQLARFPAVRERVPQSAALHFLASGPFDRPTTNVVTHGAALVGDAAGYFDPFTGQGIYQALAGARLLSACAANALHAGRADQPLFEYERTQRRSSRNMVRVQRAIEAICSRPRAADRCIQALAHAPVAATALLAVTGDLAPPLSLLSPAIATSFLLGLIQRSNHF
jgi:menaquinone-9 beta-reductase